MGLFDFVKKAGSLLLDAIVENCPTYGSDFDDAFDDSQDCLAEIFQQLETIQKQGTDIKVLQNRLSLISHQIMQLHSEGPRGDQDKPFDSFQRELENIKNITSALLQPPDPSPHNSHVSSSHQSRPAERAAYSSFPKEALREVLVELREGVRIQLMRIRSLQVTNNIPSSFVNALYEYPSSQSFESAQRLTPDQVTALNQMQQYRQQIEELQEHQKAIVKQLSSEYVEGETNQFQLNNGSNSCGCSAVAMMLAAQANKTFSPNIIDDSLKAGNLTYQQILETENLKDFPLLEFDHIPSAFKKIVNIEVDVNEEQVIALNNDLLAYPGETEDHLQTPYQTLETMLHVLFEAQVAQGGLIRVGNGFYSILKKEEAGKEMFYIFDSHGSAKISDSEHLGAFSAKFETMEDAAAFLEIRFSSVLEKPMNERGNRQIEIAPVFFLEEPRAIQKFIQNKVVMYDAMNQQESGASSSEVSGIPREFLEEHKIASRRLSSGVHHSSSRHHRSKASTSGSVPPELQVPQAPHRSRRSSNRPVASSSGASSSRAPRHTEHSPKHIQILSILQKVLANMSNLSDEAFEALKVETKAFMRNHKQLLNDLSAPKDSGKASFYDYLANKFRNDRDKNYNWLFTVNCELLNCSKEGQRIRNVLQKAQKQGQSISKLVETLLASSN